MLVVIVVVGRGSAMSTDYESKIIWSETSGETYYIFVVLSLFEHLTSKHEEFESQIHHKQAKLLNKEQSKASFHLYGTETTKVEMWEGNIRIEMCTIVQIATEHTTPNTQLVSKTEIDRRLRGKNIKKGQKQQQQEHWMRVLSFPSSVCALCECAQKGRWTKIVFAVDLVLSLLLSFSQPLMLGQYGYKTWIRNH